MTTSEIETHITAKNQKQASVLLNKIEKIEGVENASLLPKEKR